MKHFILTLTLIAAAFFPAAARANHHAMGETITVSANGLICDFCARALEKVFKERQDVSDISVDLTKKTILIETATSGALDDETITRLVTDAGYTVTGISRAPSMHHEDPAAAPAGNDTDAATPHDHGAHDHGDGAEHNHHPAAEDAGAEAGHE